MADNVHITGSDKGALTEALADLPPWATQDTAEKIAGILERTLSVQKTSFTELVKRMAGGDKLATKEFQDSIDKMAAGIDRANKAADDSTKGIRNRSEEEKRRFKEKQAMDGFMATATTQMVAGAIGVKNAMLDNFKTYRSLNSAGVDVITGMGNVSSGFNALQRLTQMTGVRFTELQSVITANSVAINSVNLGTFAKILQSSSSSVRQFGFDSKESAELLASYLETQQSSINLESRSSTSLSRSFTKLGKDVFNMSMATGMSTQTILANMKALSESNDLYILRNRLGDDAADAITSFLAPIKDQNLAAKLASLMADPAAQLNETYIALTKAGQGAFAEQLQATLRDVNPNDPREMAQRLKDMFDQNKPQISAMTQQLALLRKSEGASGDANEALSIINALTKLSNQTKVKTDEQTAEQRAANEAAAKTTSEVERLLSTAQAAFAPTLEMVSTFGTMLGDVNDKLAWLLNLVSDQTRSYTGLGIALAGLAASSVFLKKTFDVLGPKAAKTKAGGAAVRGLTSLWPQILGIGKQFLKFGGIFALVGVAVYSAMEAIDEVFGTKMIETVKGWLSSLWEMLKGIGPAITQFFPKLLSDIGTVFSNIWNSISETLSTTFQKIGDKLLELFPWLQPLVTQFNEFLQAVKEFIAPLKDIVSVIWEFLGKVVKLVPTVLQKFAENMLPSFVTSWFKGDSSKKADERQEAEIRNLLNRAYQPTVDTDTFVQGASAARRAESAIISDPKPSTIASPSKVSSTDPGETPAPGAKGASPVTSVVNDRPTGQSNINTELLSHQTNVLQQILQTANSLVSVNRELLRVTKANT